MELSTAQVEIERKNLLGPADQQFCPECGAIMIEADRINENGTIYIWYDCSGSDCNGSWLKKLENENKSLDSSNKSNKFLYFSK
jgi:DNA-directed RNA polymerase subunit M/transcription elongation factor TFIIS